MNKKDFLKKFECIREELINDLTEYVKEKKGSVRLKPNETTEYECDRYIYVTTYKKLFIKNDELYVKYTSHEDYEYATEEKFEDDIECFSVDELFKIINAL